MADENILNDSSAEEPGDDVPEAASPEGAAAELAEITRERNEYHDQLLRKAAEFDNYRKRVERERREQADRAVADLLQELLLVVDDFDRAVAIEHPPAAAAYAK